MKGRGSESALVPHATPIERPAVLVVDDIEANLLALEALIGDLDCEVVCVRSGNAALSQLLRREYAVMLLDVQMPVMDGYEVARHAHENPATRLVPIVFLTAQDRTDENMLRGYGTGAVDYLFKPIDSTILRSKVRVFLELHRTKKQIVDSKKRLELTLSELEAAQAQLVQSAKMASLGELVAGIAHEINNPLAFALSHLDTALRALGPVEAALKPSESPAAAAWDKMKSRMTEMDIGLKRIRDLVVKLRTFSRLDGDERGLVSVKACVDSVITILGHRLEGRVKVETDLGEPDIIECYPGLLNQAIMNLIANSIDAIEGPGTIMVASGGVPEERYRITVTDSGPGIPQAVRQRIFEPFFTTKPVGAGTGLGLSITYSIVEKHGGTLKVECPPTGGTTMTIELPLSARKRRREASDS
jgi:two-component system, NtrC family, sensor kinase